MQEYLLPMNNRRKLLLVLAVSVLAVFVLLVHKQYARRASVLDGPPPARTLRFPLPSMGTLFVRDWKTTNPAAARWRKWGEASGTVTIPAGKELSLKLSKQAPKAAPSLWNRILVAVKLQSPTKPTVDLSALESFGPNDLQAFDHFGCRLNDRDVRRLARHRSLKEIRLTDITDDGAAHLAKLPALEKISLWNAQVTDAGLVHLTGLTSVRELNLGGTRITGAGLKHLENLPRLTRLDLSNTKVTDAGMGHLEALTSLRYLNLYRTTITDAGLAHLKSLTSLRNLYVGSMRVTDAGLKHLSGLTSLESLGLAGTRVRGPGLAHLKTLTALQSLCLSQYQFNEETVRHLGNLKSLKTVLLDGYRGRGPPSRERGPPAELRQKLKEVLPDCGILRID